MAVLRSKRHISRYEFEHTFSELYSFSCERNAKIAKRRKKWISKNIDYQMNNIFNMIMEVTEGRFTKGQTKPMKANLIGQSIDCLIELEKPLMIMWNVEKYPTKKMVQWVMLLNNEITLLDSLCDENNKERQIMILDWHKVHSTTFLQNMSELHRYVHGKVVNAKNRYDDTDSSLLIYLIDEAFYALMSANKKIPETKSELEKRTNNISKAISCLRKMNRPMTFYFNTMGYSERIMREWSDMLATELKLLYALQKSDKSRFKDLL